LESTKQCAVHVGFLVFVARCSFAGAGRGAGRVLSDACLPSRLERSKRLAARREADVHGALLRLTPMMKLAGGVEKGLTFELEGGVIAGAPIAVPPVFGPPDRVRVDEATLDGAPASIGFEGDH